MYSPQPFTEKLRWRLNILEHKLLKYRLSTNETATVDTEYGRVKGLKRNTVYNDVYYSFEGIPYAQPPVGELRFKSPQRPTPWEQELDCTNFKEKAPQVDFIFHKVDGSEDCLYLNVYTNNLKPEKPRAVMVWIHGGGFILGEANRDYYGPDYFMKHDVILVTVQYRLGVLGFLSLNDPTLNVPGNAGLKDQVLALKWVKNNCSQFGGNPDCITVFGESAGGASTNYMMLTEQTQGLFHRAIIQSGYSIAPWAITDAAKRAHTIAQLAGYKGENKEKDILAFLQHSKARDLIRVEEQVLTLDEHREKIMFPFAPTIEPYVTADCVIPKPPKELMKKAWTSTIPVLVGNTSFEGLFFKGFLKLMPTLVDELDTCVNYVPSELTGGDRVTEQAKSLGLKIKRAHVAGEKATAEEFMDFNSFWCFLFPMHRFIQARLHYATNAPLYLYRFDFDSEDITGPFRVLRHGRGVKGVGHADELTYLFWSFVARRLQPDSAEYRTVQRLVGIWTHFAQTGNPNAEAVEGLEALNWKSLKKSDEAYSCLNISHDLTYTELPEMAKLRQWASMYDGKEELLY